MKRKSSKAVDFIEGLHKHITNHPTLRKNTSGKSEVRIQTEIRPIILEYLTKWFANDGVRSPESKAYKSFYWEAEESRNRTSKNTTFTAFSYPDFVIFKPYKIAIEYKQSTNGSTVKQGIGQSVMHTLSGDFDYVYYLFNDQSSDKKIYESVNKRVEKRIINTLWNDFNVVLKTI